MNLLGHLERLAIAFVVSAILFRLMRSRPRWARWAAATVVGVFVYLTLF